MLKAEALSLPPGAEQQTWDCKTAQTGAYLQRRVARDHHYEFAAAAWR